MIPDADGYTDDGKQVFSIKSGAAMFEISMEEAQVAMDAMLQGRAALGRPAVLADSAMVHRKH